MKIKMCRCFMCKYGLRHSKKEKKTVKQHCKGARKRNKQYLRENMLEKISDVVLISYIG